jgi:dynein light chain 1
MLLPLQSSKKEPAPSTSTRDAVGRWLASSGADVATAKHVQLQAMLPPIARLDMSVLAGLTACEHLSLSSNSLSTMPSFGCLRSLRILSLGRNQLKRLENLADVAGSLEQLWISYNAIDSLSGGGLERCMRLTHLYCSNNKIRKLDELLKIVSRYTHRGTKEYARWRTLICAVEN